MISDCTVRLGTVKLTTSSNMATTSGMSAEDEAYVCNYTDAFPPLPAGEKGNATPVSGQWSNKFTVKTSKCTQVLPSNVCELYKLA